MDISDIPKKAREAIKRGIRRGDAVVRMEFLELPLRIINLLEDSKYKIVKLEDLLKRKREELLEIPSMAATSLNQVYAALSRYHELDGIEAEEEADVQLRTLDDESTNTNRGGLWEL